MDKTEKIQKLYDAIYDKYDIHMRKSGHYTAQENIIKLLFGQVEEPILDLACGTGFLINLLKKKFSSINGNDFSKKMSVAASLRTGLKITNENAEKLVSYNKKYKTIICCNLFFYLQDRKTAIWRWKSLLHKNGRVIYLEEYPFIKPVSNELDAHSAKLMAIVDPVEPELIERLMIEEGFQLSTKKKVKIDNKHNMYGLVFTLKNKHNYENKI
jgi:ubiquinone/menaquinone biosynthesis C-methylase UbiE